MSYQPTIMADFKDERLTRLFDYWLSKRDARQAPRRDDVRPGEIKPYLPIVQLIDVHRDPLRFKHRLVGTELVERLGRNVMGKWVDEELYGSATSDVLRQLTRVAVEARPYRTLASLDYMGRPGYLMEAMELPLLAAEGHVGMLLRAASFFYGADSLPNGRINEPMAVS